MKPVTHLRIAGVLQIVLSLAHLLFPARFHWHEELARLSLLNRQIFWVHTFFIMLVLVLFALLSLLAAEELVRPGKLPRLVLGGIGVFWATRLLFQFFVYDSTLWRGITFNTVAHIGFSGLWAYFAFAYGNALFRNLKPTVQADPKP
jgi:hypothetical protein